MNHIQYNNILIYLNSNIVQELCIQNNNIFASSLIRFQI
jgi:hypothetical protein